MTKHARLPDGSAFFVMTVPRGPNRSDPIRWNPYNRVVQDHRDGTIDHVRTNAERATRGLPVPWTPAIGKREIG